MFVMAGTPGRAWNCKSSYQQCPVQRALSLLTGVKKCSGDASCWSEPLATRGSCWGWILLEPQEHFLLGRNEMVDVVCVLIHVIFWVVMSISAILWISPGRMKELQFSPNLTLRCKFSSLVEFLTDQQIILETMGLMFTENPAYCVFLHSLKKLWPI